IRAPLVTGVQTCALPIFVQGTVLDLISGSLTATNAPGDTVQGTLPANAYSTFSYLLEPQYASHAGEPVDPGVGQSIADAVHYLRSEERRVGKAGRSWRRP